MDKTKYIVGTSGYSFVDWSGVFYPEGTRAAGMFDFYAQHFQAVELNFTFYAMPSARTLASLARRAPKDFEFWVKANQELTHKHNRAAARVFAAGLEPLQSAGKLSGVLLQFPQSFRRTVESRVYLAGLLDDLKSLPLAVEFRHKSWAEPATLDGMRERNVAVVVPDVPPIESLYALPPTATNRTGYLRLHSRNADGWYAGMAERYDYDYSEAELRDILEKWSPVEPQVDRVYVMFNNCHRGQAAQNAEAFRRILGQIE